MTATHDSGAPRPARWLDGLKRTRFVLAAAALAFGALWLLGAIAAAPALAGFALIAAAVLIATASAETTPALLPRDEPRAPRIGDPLIEAVLAGLPDPVVALDHRGDVVALNVRAAAVAPALRPGESVSLGLRVPEVLEAIRHARASGTSQRAEFFQRVPFDRWYEAIVTPILSSGADSRPGLLLLAFHDLTPLRRVEEMRADFVANASHELRTPLAALSGFIDTLQGPAKDDAKARERFLGIMHAQATRMARLIDDLLSLSRVELSAHVRPDTLVDIVPIIRQVADGLEPLAHERQVTVDIDLPDAPVSIAGDREELLRLFENLIENALKYGASGGKVVVSLTSAMASEGVLEVRVMVRDFGPGIAPEHLPRLTERFYRVDVGDSRAQGGTGLGLSLVKHILARHRGRLLIESAPKNGATFTACFHQANTGETA